MPSRGLTLIAVAALLCSGCLHDPKETVTLRLSGADSETTQLVLDRIVPRMLDSDRATYVSYRQSGSGGVTHARASPVTDIDQFVERCWFGSVTRRNGRELWVSVNPGMTYGSIAVYWVADTIESLPAQLKLWRTILKAYCVSAFTGRNFDEVFWSIAPHTLSFKEVQ